MVYLCVLVIVDSKGADRITTIFGVPQFYYIPNKEWQSGWRVPFHLEVCVFVEGALFTVGILVAFPSPTSPNGSATLGHVQNERHQIREQPNGCATDALRIGYESLRQKDSFCHSGLSQNAIQTPPPKKKVVSTWHPVSKNPRSTSQEEPFSTTYQRRQFGRCSNICLQVDDS